MNAQAVRVGGVCILITRPEPECSRWVQALVHEGLSAVALPLIEIVNLACAEPASQSVDVLMFVSRSAVHGFLKQVRKEDWLAKACLVTGPGTRLALLEEGWRADSIDMPEADAAQFDSEALWRIASGRNWHGKRVLIVRGANGAGKPEGRNWLAEQLLAAGAQVDFVATYTRRLPALTPLMREVLEQPQAGNVWLLSSSQSLAHLKLLAPTLDLHHCRALATHDRIASAARDAGFGAVDVVRPLLADVVYRVKRMQ